MRVVTRAADIYYDVGTCFRWRRGAYAVYLVADMFEFTYFVLKTNTNSTHDPHGNIVSACVLDDGSFSTVAHTWEIKTFPVMSSVTLNM